MTIDQAKTWVDHLRWNAEGLLPVVVQEVDGQVLMHAWMNRDALMRSTLQGEAVYWSRSRQCLWHKGEQSGHTQRIVEIRVDCDSDALLLSVQQKEGIACHTGRRSCFFKRLEKERWMDVEPVLKSPQQIYEDVLPERDRDQDSEQGK